jgi:predicted acylesterase/phospholipase RssA
MYKTETLHDALRASLGTTKIYGGKGKTTEFYGTKVAVTSSTISANRAIVIANYNREGRDLANHTFARCDNPNQELELWEAAAASTAAPPFFSPFYDKKTNQEYLDGALFNNNPARLACHESHQIWPEVARLPPDLLLSLGTGKQFDTDELASEELAGRSARQLKGNRGSNAHQTAEGRSPGRLRKSFNAVVR